MFIVLMVKCMFWVNNIQMIISTKAKSTSTLTGISSHRPIDSSIVVSSDSSLPIISATVSLKRHLTISFAHKQGTVYRPKIEFEIHMIPEVAIFFCAKISHWSRSRYFYFYGREKARVGGENENKSSQS